MNWKQILFRIIGVVSVWGGLYAFYDYGRDLLPIFTKFVGGTYDTFEIFTVFSSFFLGALALTWVGMRLTALRSFSSSWLYFLVFPITAWLQKLYDVGAVLSSERTLSLSIVYLCIYIVILNIVLFVHKHWFSPVSHEDEHHVSLEKSSTPFFIEFRWAILLGTLLVLIIFNPQDALHIFNIVILWLTFAWMWIQG